MLDPSSELRHTGVVKFPPSVQSVEAVAAATHDGQTRSAVVRLLLESGSITAGQIGDQLGLSAAGVRRHLDVLIDVGEAESVPAAPWQQAGRGRPAKRYRLTATGRAKLDHSYDDLASAAMRQLREIGGEEAVRSFARQRIDTILSGVEAADSDADEEIEATAERIAGALSKAGYVATTTQVGGPIHGVQICQHHCPVSHVAEEFPELVRNRAAGDCRGAGYPRAAVGDNRQRRLRMHHPRPARRGRRKTD